MRRAVSWSMTLAAGLVTALLCLPRTTGLVAADGADNRAAAGKDVGAQPTGTLVIVGGALRFDNTAVWSRIVEAAGGRGASIAVIPLASKNPRRAAQRAMETLKSAGAEPFEVPAEPDAQTIQRVRQARGAFFTGGEQRRIVEALRTADGGQAPLLDALWDVYRGGGVIAGTSAGAAVMSRIMYRDAEFVLSTLLDGVRMGKETDRGLGFMDGEWFIDQHAIVRGRFARALVAMREYGFKFALGVDENTAVVVSKPSANQDPQAEIIGHQGAVFLDLSAATHDDKQKGFNLKNAKVSYLDRGDAINLKTRRVTPSSTKLGGHHINPSGPNFVPAKEHPMVFNDILANSTLRDVLAKLIDNKKSEATGLAFDTPSAQREPTRGFEFKFYRGPDSEGWETGAWGDDALTVINIHLDVNPIKVSGPLVDR